MRSDAGGLRKVASQNLARLLTPGNQQPFFELCCAIEARRAPMSNVVVQFTSPASGTGTTTAASGYARTAAVQAYQPVLYVAWTRPNHTRVDEVSERPSLVDAFRRGLPLDEATAPARDAENLLWAQMFTGSNPMIEIGLADLQALLSALRARYSLTVLDCPPCTSPDAVAVSRFVDGSVVVAAAHRTRQREIKDAASRIERAGGQIVGVVFNRHRRVLPRWLDRRL